jgi:outer membrane protein OmpA-like peptidoglycan-associated protein
MLRLLKSVGLVIMFFGLLCPWAPAGAEETEIPGVTASLEFIRQYQGVLRLGVKLANGTDKEARVSKPIQFSKIAITDAKAGKKYSPLKGADGQYLAGPISDNSDGGRWFPAIPPKSEVLLWVFFDAVPSGIGLTVQVPLMFAFEGVKVSEQPVTLKEVGGAVPPLKASLVSATRSAGQLKVRLKIVNPGQTKAAGGALRYADTFAFDTANKRKYPLLKDQSGKYLAEPISDDKDGGRYWYSYVEPGGQTLVSLTFQPPPDTTKTVDLVLPLLSPLENIPLSGEGGAATAGVAVAGKSQNLEGALQELKADVTAQEIKVQLKADLLFDFDKADIKKEAEPVLDKVALVLKSYPQAKVLVEGHTDSLGKDVYNQTLSDKRAATVAQWLQAHSGLPKTQFQTKGWGKTKPVVHNTRPDGSDDPEGRAKNRRVEVVIKKTGR